MQGFIITLLICSVTMSALALLYMAVTPLLTGYSVTGRYYTWLVLVLGLIIPFRPPLGGAVFRVAVPAGTAAPALQIGDRAPLAVNVPAPDPGAHASALFSLSWWQLAAALWLAGMALFLAYHVFSHYRFLKLAARWSENVADGETLALLGSLKTEMGISRRMDLQYCDCIGTPMMTGFLRPRILLPRLDFAQDELAFILKHELVHYKRGDLWYKSLVLAASAVHWFNPIILLMTKAIDIQCELSCDAQVVRRTDADTRQVYCETIIGVVRYQSRLKTAFSTNFYGGKKGMKNRIFSIMDMRKKKAGLAVLCGALLFTLGTGAAFAAKTETQDPSQNGKEVVSYPNAAIYTDFMPSPDLYTPYASFGLTVSEDGAGLNYNGQPVRQFVDEKAESWAFYLNGAGKLNLTAVRDGAGKITGIESMTAQKAQEYYESFFREELDPDYSERIQRETARDLAEDTAKENVQENAQEGGNKYAKYQSFGVAYAESDGTLRFQGQRVKFFIDQPADGSPDVLWTDGDGTVNLAAIRDASGNVTGVESISEEKAQEYRKAAETYSQKALNGLEERVEARVKAKYPES